MRSYQSGLSEGFIDDVSEGNSFGGARMPGASVGSPHWRSIVYDELDNHHKKVMELAFGMHGRKPLPNHVIADKLNRSPGAISQAKARIQAKLDEEFELSPFGG